MDPLGQNVDTAVVTGDVIRAELLWTLKVVMCHYSFNSCNDISATFSSKVSWQWYCEDFHLWSNQVRISDMLWTCSIFPWAAGGYDTKYSMLFDIIRWVYEQDITKQANGLHHQILGRQYQQGGCTIPWIWVSRPCHSCRPFDPFQTRDQPTGSQTATSGVYGWTKC